VKAFEAGVPREQELLADEGDSLVSVEPPTPLKTFLDPLELDLVVLAGISATPVQMVFEDAKCHRRRALTNENYPATGPNPFLDEGLEDGPQLCLGPVDQAVVFAM
jgi:hypothetical protein